MKCSSLYTFLGVYINSLLLTHRETFSMLCCWHGHTHLAAEFEQISFRFQGNNFKYSSVFSIARLFKQDVFFSKCVTHIKYPNTQQYYFTRISLHVAVLIICVCERRRVCSCYFSCQSLFRNWSLGFRISTLIRKKWIELYWTTNFMVAQYINKIKHFIFQLMHTNCKILRLLK